MFYVKAWPGLMYLSLARLHRMARLSYYRTVLFITYRTALFITAPCYCFIYLFHVPAAIQGTLSWLR